LPEEQGKTVKYDLHRLLMGLQMAIKMSEDKDVLVYFDITGIEAVLTDSPDFQYSHFPGSLTQINELLSNGVTLMACPGWLKAADKTEDDLMEGIEVADKDKFFTFTNGRILTLDY
jgi:predicted peroxiredoxin